MIQDAISAAMEALRAGRWAEAEVRAGEAVAADPASPRAQQMLVQARLTLARAQASSGEADAADATLARACNQRPTALEAFIALGEMRKARGDLAGAETVFQQGLGLAPDAQALWLGLASVRMAANDRLGARAAIAHLDGTRFGARIARAQLAFLEGDFAVAAMLYGEALTERPDAATIRMERARALAEAGERAAAEAELRRLARDGPLPLGRLILALAAAAHGRAFLRPTDAARFLNGAPEPAAA